jgi:hypothetical protein
MEKKWDIMVFNFCGLSLKRGGLSLGIKFDCKELSILRNIFYESDALPRGIFFDKIDKNCFQ